MTRLTLRPVALVLLLAAACTVGPDYSPPDLPVPARFLGAEGPDDNSKDVTSWWRAFDDPTLDALIEQAAAANLDVAIAVAHVRAARAALGAAEAAGRPRVDSHASYTDSRFSDNGFLKGLIGNQSGPSGAAFPGQQIELDEVGFDASWELDLFGGVRREREAARAEIEAADADLRGVQVSLVAEVAVRYLALRSAQARLPLAEAMLGAEREAADVLAERAAAGVGDERDVIEARRRVATAQALPAELTASARSEVRALETLLGVQPGALDVRLAAAAPLPTPPDAFAAAIPSEVLRRRPDVRAAERRLAAATARIGVATADAFPRFSLTGTFGLQSQRLDQLAEGDSVFWLLGPSIRWPLLDFGRMRARIASAGADADAALAQYQKTVLVALGDVEVALVRLARDQRRRDAFGAARAASEQQVALAEERYQRGVLEYVDLLEARNENAGAADQAARAALDLATDVVALCKALGGGFAR